MGIQSIDEPLDVGEWKQHLGSLRRVWHSGHRCTGNVPGVRNASAQWQDSSGNFWIFGGYGYDANGASSYLSDLWKFNPSTSQWTWMGGSNIHGQSGVYGTLGTASAANIPGSREDAMSWTDKSGNLWLFGGAGTDSAGSVGFLNDLWEFNPATSQWTWMGGGSVLGCANCAGLATYGTLGTPAAGNIPGGRDNSAIWTDSGGNVWLFGGYVDPANGDNASTELNDLWEFNPTTNLWAWMGGSNAPAGNQNGVYGTMGTPAPANIPGGRDSMVNWTDASGNLWLFGGYGFNGGGGEAYLGDLWEFSPFTNEWTWMVGSNTNGTNSLNKAGVPGTLGVPSASNFPGSRDRDNGWVDRSGNFWLFGGTGRDASNSNKTLNDLWVYEPVLSSLTQAATPTYTVASGTYTSIQSVTINDATAGATIYYTTNGTAPTANSPVYSGGPITVSSTETLEAVAIVSGDSASATATAAYTILLPTATPVISLASGTYDTPQTVTISDATAGAVIYYAINGTPTTSSPTYSGPITVSSTEALEAIALASGYSISGLATATATVQLTVNKATPVITWSNPTAITYGTALSATQLNASSSVGGSFVYSPAAGTVLSGGTQTLSVTFIPTNTTDYATATASVTLLVNPAAQTVTFPALSSPVTYGVSPITLSATASSGLAVTFSATGPATVSGNLLTITGAGAVVVTASQPGNADYSVSNTVSRNLNVTKATPLASLTPSETSGPYGTSVTLTATLTGAGVAPAGTVTFRNNGSSLGTGTLTGGVATLATSALPVGSDSITASYGGDIDYVAATSAGVGVTGTQATQTISLSASSPVTYGVSPITLSATATSGLAVTFSATGPATLNGSKLTITGVGTVVVTANQAGNTDYSAAPAVTQSITIDQATPTAVLTSGANPIAYGGSAVLTATLTGSGVKPTGTVTFLNGTVTLGTGTLSAGGVAKLTVTSLPVGVNSITASYAGDSNYTQVTSAPLTETVNQATPTVKFTGLPHTAATRHPSP